MVIPYPETVFPGRIIYQRADISVKGGPLVLVFVDSLAEPRIKPAQIINTLLPVPFKKIESFVVIQDKLKNFSFQLFFVHTPGMVFVKQNVEG
jgi:hypothetical protein